MFNHARVLAKFYPPHAGHHRLVRAAAAQSRCSARRPSPSRWADRVRWLAEEHVADDGVAIIGDVDDTRSTTTTTRYGRCTWVWSAPC